MKYFNVVTGQTPIASYRLNETSGVVANTTPSALNGAYGSGLQLGQSGPSPLAFRGFDSNNRAVQFDKDDFQSRVTLPTAVGMDSFLGSATLWFNILPSEIDADGGILFYGTQTFGDGFGSANEHHVQIDINGQITVFIEGTEPNTQIFKAGSGVYADGAWHHLAFTWDKSNVGDNAARLYVDGQQILAVTHDANGFDFAGAIHLGGPDRDTVNFPLGHNRLFGGRMDEVALFNRALTAQEVQTQYYASRSADFDQDNDIDGADFLIWQRGANGGTTFEAGDADANGVVSVADLAVWASQFGTVIQAATAAPEPATLVPLMLAGMAMASHRRSYGGCVGEKRRVSRHPCRHAALAPTNTHPNLK